MVARYGDVEGVTDPVQQKESQVYGEKLDEPTCGGTEMERKDVEPVNTMSTEAKNSSTKADKAHCGIQKHADKS